MHAQAKKAFYRILIGSLCLVAFLAILIILAGDFDDTDARIIGTIFAIVLYSWTAYVQSLLADRRPALALFALAGIGASIVGFSRLFHRSGPTTGRASSGGWPAPLS